MKIYKKISETHAEIFGFVVAGDKIDHFLFIGFAFSVFAGILTVELIQYLFPELNFWINKAISSLIGAGFATYVGIKLEKWQEKTGKGVYQMSDIRADIYGAITGAVLVFFLTQMFV